MALPHWPAELPQRVMHPGFSERMPDGRLFSRMDSGPGKSRRRYSSAAQGVAARILVDIDQKARFERFWNEETKGGVLPFIMPDQTHDNIDLAISSGEIADTQGDVDLVIASNWLVLFGEDAPTVSIVSGTVYAIDFSLKVMP